MFRSQKNGVIVNVSSLAAWRGGAALGIYAASKWAVSAITEALHAEVAEIGIRVCSIEPGYFRSNLLTPGNTVSGELRIADYDGTLARRNMEKWAAIDQSQPGDVAKAAKVIADVVTRTGCAEGREIPVRLLLGSDAFEVVNSKCTTTVSVLKEWEGVTKSTDF